MSRRESARAVERLEHRRVVGRGKVLASGTAVHKISGLTAQRFGLTDRGVIAPSIAADLCVFDADVVIDKATYKEPEQASAGVDRVVVNGPVAWRQGQMGACSGRLLLRLE